MQASLALPPRPACAVTLPPLQSDTQGDVRVWFNGEESQDTDRRAAAALVADG